MFVCKVFTFSPFQNACDRKFCILMMVFASRAFLQPSLRNIFFIPARTSFLIRSREEEKFTNVYTCV